MNTQKLLMNPISNRIFFIYFKTERSNYFRSSKCNKRCFKSNFISLYEGNGRKKIF